MEYIQSSNTIIINYNFNEVQTNKYIDILKKYNKMIFSNYKLNDKLFKVHENNKFDKIPMYHLEDMLYLSTSEGMDIMSSIGHPTNGILLEDFRQNYPKDINRRIVKFAHDTFDNIPKVSGYDRNSAYFLLRWEAKDFSYEEMDKMYYVFEHYYDKKMI